jgi:hypothetical protein
MKKLLPLKLLLLITFSIINLISCKRQDVFSLTNNDQSTKEMLVSYLNQQKNIDPSATKFFDTLVNKADWNRVTEVAISNLVKIIYVPLNYNANNIGMTFLFNNKTQKIYYSLITEMPTNNKSAIHHTTATSFNRPIDIITGFYKKNLSDYTGFIRAYTISNNLLWEFGYKNGERKYEKRVTSSYNENPASNPSQIKSNSNESKLVKPNGCKNWYLVTWYNDGSSDWDYIGTTCSDECFNSIKLTQDSIRIKSNCGTAPQGGGGGSGASRKSPDDIITIDIKSPCLKELINRLINSNDLNGNIGNILVSTFGVSDKINITFIEDNNLKDRNGNPSLGSAGIDNGIPNYDNLNVKLNATKLSQYSQESQTLTIMHEVLHSTLIQKYKTQTDQSLIGHVTLLKSYINNMANTLVKIYPTLKAHPGLAEALTLEDLFSSVGNDLSTGNIPVDVFNQTLDSLDLGFSSDANQNNFWHNTSVMGLYPDSEYATQMPCSANKNKN